MGDKDFQAARQELRRVMINALDHEPRGDIIFKAAYDVVFSREAEELQQPTSVSSSAEQTKIFDWVNELVQSSTTTEDISTTKWSAVNSPHPHRQQDQLVNNTRAIVSNSPPAPTWKRKATQNDYYQERVPKQDITTRSTAARSTGLRNDSSVPVRRQSKRTNRTSTRTSASARKTPLNESTSAKTASDLKPSSTSPRLAPASASSESPRRSTRVQKVSSTQQTNESQGGIDDLLWASEVLAGMETPMPE